MSRYKNEIVRVSVLDALSNFYSELSELRDECQEVVDNAPESLQSSPRIETMQETTYALDLEEKMVEGEGIRIVETMDPVEVCLSVRGGRKRGQESRAVRCGNAVAYGRAFVDAVIELVERESEEIEQGRADGNPEDLSEGALALAFSMQDERLGALEKLEHLCEEIEEDIDAAGGAEFPGMMG